MTLIIPYILSITLGYLVVERFTRKAISSWGLKLGLSLCCGLGLSGILTFLTLLSYGQYSSTLLFVLHIAIIAILISLDFKNLKQLPSSLITYFKNRKGFDYITLTLFILLAFLLYAFAIRYPYGGWDAWALWNMKLKFILLGEHNWRNIFTLLHWHAQPDYPLLLSCINAWLCAISKNNVTTAPLATAVILSWSVALIVFSALKEFISKYIALTATLLMTLNSYYILLSTSQYSDVLLAVYVLCSIVLMSAYFKTQQFSLCFLTALFLGLMTFTKNEGIVISLILMTLLGTHLLIKHFKETSQIKNISILIIGYGLIAAISASFKLFLTPNNPDIVPFGTAVEYEFLNMDGFLLVMKHFLNQVFHPQWAFVWALIIGSHLLFLPRFYSKKNIVFTLFFILYGSVIVYIYLTTINFDLSWRLTFTLKRIMFYLLPAVMFINFRVIFEENESKLS